MNRQPLWQLSLRIVAEAEELVSEIAAQVFKHPVASYTDADTGRITLTVYSHLRDEFSNKRLADFRVRLGALAAAGANQVGS